MKDPSFVKIIEDLGKDTQTLVKHMSDNRVMTALAVLLDVDITVPECKFVYWTSDMVRGRHSCLCSSLSEQGFPRIEYWIRNHNSIMFRTIT